MGAAGPGPRAPEGYTLKRMLPDPYARQRPVSDLLVRSPVLLAAPALYIERDQRPSESIAESYVELFLDQRKRHYVPPRRRAPWAQGGPMEPMGRQGGPRDRAP